MGRLTFNQLLDLKLLLSVDGIGPGKIRNLLAKFSTLERILSADFNSLTHVEGISTTLAKKIQLANKNRNSALTTLKKEIEKLEKINGKIITVWDESFPPLLKKIYDPPLLLYAKGSFIKDDEYTIAIVGTRNPTNYGKVQTEKVASELASQNITVTSGMARGIDSIAHKATLKQNGRTIAITGSGLDVIYPPENVRLYDEIAEKGLIITEYEPGTKPDAVNFPRRNRIISGLSLGCIIIETGINGGAMQTAALALDQNREVFSVPGNIGIKQSEGTNLLIQRGEAKLIRSAEDVLIELELKLKPVIGKNISKPKIELNLFEEKILSVLKDAPQQIDVIATLTGLTTSDCLVHLLSLEFNGLVKQLPGKIFALL